MVIMSQIMTVLVMMLMRRLQYRTFEKLMMMLAILPEMMTVLMMMLMRRLPNRTLPFKKPG